MFEICSQGHEPEVEGDDITVVVAAVRIKKQVCVCVVNFSLINSGSTISVTFPFDC